MYAIYAYIGVVLGVNGAAYMAYMECLGMFIRPLSRVSASISRPPVDPVQHRTKTDWCDSQGMREWIQ